MPTNHFFQHGFGIGTESEQKLLQQLVNETIQIAGIDFVYIPRKLVKLDEIFKEDTLSEFSKNYKVEMYIENYDGFTGEGEMIGKFGFYLNDQIRLIVSKERFFLIVGETYPKEGDLVYYPVTKHLFEIKWVDDKNPLYPLGSRQYFAIVCETFKYSHENIQTNTEIDTIAPRYDDDVNKIFGKNTIIDQKAEPLIDFSEKNPFSERNL